jgi:virginiamycin B lyase
LLNTGHPTEPGSTLWFTNESTNYIGRLDPSTGKMQLKQSPTPHAIPYGIVITKTNAPFFCEFGTNKLASIAPKTMAIREYALPAKNARPRRIALAPDGTIYFTDYARGYLGHFDPATGKLLKGWRRAGRVQSIWHRGHQRRCGLVQRIGCGTQHSGQV